MLPETLRLADYGLGHDDRALEHQPVASRLGARFFDWQLAQSTEESWRECHVHARNLLGKNGYLDFLATVVSEASFDGWRIALTPACELAEKTDLLSVFVPALAAAPVETWRDRIEAIRAILTERGSCLESADMTGLLLDVFRRVPEAAAADAISYTRHLLDEKGYRRLLADIETERRGARPQRVAEAQIPYVGGNPQNRLFD